MVYSRDILGEPGSLNSAAARLLEDHDGEKREGNDRDKEERTLEELRFIPGDYLSIAVLLPKSVTLHEPTANSANKTSAGPNGQGWRAGKSGFNASDGGWNGTLGASAPASGGPPVGRGSGGHWRGGSDAPPAGPAGRGRGGRFGIDGARRDVERDYEDRDRDRERDRDRDRRIPPPRRGRETPPRRGGTVRGRDRRSPSSSRSRSRSPPARRPRYE